MKISIFTKSALLSIPMLLWGCAGLVPAPTALSMTATSQPSPAQPAEEATPTSNAGTAAVKQPANRLQATSLTHFHDADITGRAVDEHFSNSYTRVVIRSSLGNEILAPGVGKPESAPNQDRNLLTRLLLGKKVDLNLSAKIKIGDYETTASLLTISHQSNSDGELWNRSVSHALLNFPLFLVRQDGEANIPEISFSFAGTTEYSSNMAAAALQVAIGGIQQVSPDAGVITKLTAQASKDKARAIDKALQNIFSSGVKEMHMSHRDLRKSQPAGGVSVELWIPNKEGKWDEKDLRTLGAWSISFDAPRPSIFSDWSLCTDQTLRCQPSREKALHAVHLDINPGQVLNYNLVKSGNSLGTIKAYLLQQDWYVSAASEFSGIEPTDRKVGDKFCKDIYNTITNLGLNGDDADIVIYAVTEGLPLPNKRHATSFQDPFCSKSLKQAKT